MLFPPLYKRNTRDKAKVLCIPSERCIGELGVRYLTPEIEDWTRGNSLLYRVHPATNIGSHHPLTEERSVTLVRKGSKINRKG